MTSLNDIEQDDFKNYYEENPESSVLMNALKIKRDLGGLKANSDRALTKILEVPSKNITRNNSFTDADTATGGGSGGGGGGGGVDSKK